MNKLQFKSFLLLIFFAFTSIITAQELEIKNMNSELPVDPSVTIGKLDNGLTYYIKENNKPEDRALFQILVYAGSVQEDEDQKGLAHFLEHMCFNGTENFPKNELIDFLESTGMRFGADINDSTGFERTLYFVEVPTDSAEIMKNGMKVLEEWAHKVSLDPKEIEKERGVIMEEWRVYKGAQDRVMKKHYPVMFHDSRFADRLPIGDTSVIQNAPREAFLRFYEDWYRPSLMAVIAVGDFDKDKIEQMIKKRFSKIKPVENPKEHKIYPVPDHEKTLVSVASDKELQYSMVQMYFKHNDIGQGTYKNYREKIKDNLMAQMLNARLQELTRLADPPFYFAGGGNGRFVGNKGAMSLIAVVNSEAIEKGTKALMEEAFRARQHGFTETEFERAKTEVLRNIRKAHKEKDKTENIQYAMEYGRNYMHGEGIPGIDYELKLHEKFVPEITLQEVNEVVEKYIKKENLVIAVSAQEKEGAEIPSEDEILALYQEVSNSKLDPYVDEVSDKPFFDKDLLPGNITEEKEIEELGVTELKLTNGARVILKPTDFKNDEVIMRAYSLGGTSLASDDIYYSAENADAIVDEAGISEFNATELQKLLAGKVISISPFIGELTEGIRGSYSPEDTEEFFQYLHMLFTDPRKDEESFQSFITRTKDLIESSSKAPRTALRDTMNAVLHKHHYREMPMTPQKVDQIELDDAFTFYKNRFDDASDFTFFFVGNFDVEEMKDHVRNYIASLPTKDEDEKWVDRNIELQKGKIRKEVYKGIEPQSFVYLVMHDDFEYEPKNRFAMNSMIEVLRIKLREEIREEQGGVYGIGAFASTDKYPDEEYRIYMMFGCNPARANELIGIIKDIIQEMVDNPPDEEYMTKVKEIMKNEHEVKLKENDYWLNALYRSDYYGEDPTRILDYNKKVDALTAEDIHNAAKKYLTTPNFAEFVLYPEDQE